MEFKVSKKKFILNELLTSILILILVSVIFSMPFAFSVIVFLWIFICKKRKYYNDLLYINGNCIRLKKQQRYNQPRSGGRTAKIVREEYDVIQLESFKENLFQFVLYGNIEMRKTVYKRSIYDSNENIEEQKTAAKLIIRKNFENEQEIRNLLNCSVESTEITNKEFVYYKYYRIKSRNAEESVIFKVDQINKLWMHLDKNGKWNGCGDLTSFYESKKEELEEITEQEVISIQNELNKN